MTVKPFRRRADLAKTPEFVVGSSGLEPLTSAMSTTRMGSAEVRTSRISCVEVHSRAPPRVELDSQIDSQTQRTAALAATRYRRGRGNRIVHGPRS